jgi:hypothetical protein
MREVAGVIPAASFFYFISGFEKILIFYFPSAFLLPGIWGVQSTWQLCCQWIRKGHFETDKG